MDTPGLDNLACDPARVDSSVSSPSSFHAAAVPHPRKGELVVDASGRIGVIMDVLPAHRGNRAYLRPPDGGCEWDVEESTLTTVPNGVDGASA